MGAPRILLVEDDDAVRLGVEQALELADLPVTGFAAAEPALELLRRDGADVLITDVRLPGMDGLALLRAAMAVDTGLPVILMTGHGDIAMAVGAMRDGAYDFIEKPFASDRLVATVNRALERRRLVAEVGALRQALVQQDGLDAALLGRSAGMMAVKKLIRQVADTGADVLILGETGSGKEMVAHALHQLSKRATKPFVAINCGAIPDSMVESELFGHEAGAFTGAAKTRIGKLEFADGGTVFLDEIESMPMAAQVKLLRVLQDRRVERLGSNRSIALNIRFVAATKADLGALSKQGRFREDLYFRLNVVPLSIPPLRQRRDDIPMLLDHFLLAASDRLGTPPPLVPAADRHALLAHAWPGNVRELRNVADRMALGLPALLGGGADAVGLAAQVEAFERQLIMAALTDQKGDVSAAAEALAVPKKTLYDKLKRFDIEIEAFR
jgi:DNA-binding NtrC family response regulator